MTALLQRITTTTVGLVVALSAVGIGHETDGSMPMSPDAMTMGEGWMVMNETTDERPPGCREIRGEREVTVEAGRRFASDHSGTTWTFDRATIEAPPCTRLTVTFVNHDDVRHQFMVHGLPVLTYPMGMFSIEVSGSGEATGTFVTPAERETYRIHCGVPTHESKGMKMQLKVGGGDGNLPGIPGVSSASLGLDGTLNRTFLLAGGVGVIVGALGWLGVALLRARLRRL